MITVDQVKLSFFSDAMLKDVQRETNRRIVRMAAYTRSVARNSIKRPGKTKRTQKSEPGRPPRSHTGLLKNHIYFWMDRRTGTAEVGPAALIGTAGRDIPGNLEQGGPSGTGDYVRPRPYMGPALEKMNERADQLFNA